VGVVTNLVSILLLMRLCSELDLGSEGSLHKVRRQAAENTLSRSHLLI